MTNNLGKRGEDLAKQFLSQKGITIVAMNWRFGKTEIDIVGQTKEYIIFVEVKTRSTDFFGEPFVFVTKAKQKKIIKVANHYITTTNCDLEARFDIVSIVVNNNHVEIDHIERAFFPSI